MQRVEIILRGEIDRDWADWLGNLAIDHASDGNTILRGTVRDQAAVHGLISQLYSLGLQVISVSSPVNPTGEEEGMKDKN